MYLRTLGGLALEDTSFSRPKPLLLLAYLALEGPKPRRYLADLFFMDAADRMNSLSRAFSDLRKEAPGSIETDSKKAWTTLKCDALELLNLSENKQYEKSLELYKGGFAVDYKLELSEELSEWLYGTREILAAKARNAFLISGEQEASKGNFPQAAFLAEKAYKLREAAELEPDDFGRLYNLLYAGNSSLALEVKKEAESFDIPLNLTREEAKAQFETSESIQEIPNNLPLAKTTFVGRDQELIEIAQQLAKPECRLLTLHGMGGIGKSRTAIQVAYDQVQGTRGILSQVEGNPLFLDGVYFIALDALTSADMIPSAIAEVLDFEMQGIDDVLTQVQKHIGKKKILLILDNFEHLMDGATLPSTLLSSCPELKVIVTTREVLKLEEEWVKNLEGLHYPSNTNLTLEEAQGYEAVQLFIQRAKRVMLEFSMTEDNMSTIIEICQLVEGAPLALELAAVWVRVMTLGDIVKEIKENLNFLESQSRNGSERHRSIRAVFEHSWKLLSPKEQEVLRKLSVFVGGFRREAAAEVAGATLPMLASLVDKSLLRVSETGRYDRHQLIYQYTQEKLVETPLDKTEIEDRHGEFFFQFLQQQGQAMWSNVSYKALKALDEDIDNLRRAWNWAISNQKADELHKASDFVIYFHRRARFQEGEELFAQAANCLDPNNPEHLPILREMLTNQAWLNYVLGHYNKAIALAQKGLNLLESLNDADPTIMKILNILAVTHIPKGCYVEASEYAHKALALAHEHKLQDQASVYLANLALAEKALGQYPQAKQHYLEVLEYYQKQQNAYGQVSCLNNIGTLELYLHDPQAALATLEKTLKLAKEIDFREQIPDILDSLAAVYLELGDYSKARALCKEAFDFLLLYSNSLLKATLNIKLGRIALALIDYPSTQQYFEDSLRLAQSIQNIPAILEAVSYFAELQYHLGHTERALTCWHEVLNHPGTEYEVKLQTRRTLDHVTKQLTLEQTHLIRNNGSPPDINAFVESLLQQPTLSS